MIATSNLQILGLVSSAVEVSRLAPVLTDLHCTAHLVTDESSALEAAGGREIDFLLVSGEHFGHDVETKVDNILRKLPGVRVVVCLKDNSISRWIAAKCHGYSVPWPLKPEYLRSIFTGTRVLVHEVEPRREVRHRILTHGDMNHTHFTLGEETCPVLILNISNHGVMLLTERSVTVGENVTLSLRYGVRSYRLAGKVRHISSNASLSGLSSADLALVKGNPQIVGVKFDAEYESSSKQLVATIAEERHLMSVRVACVPTAPDFLDAMFQRFHVEPVSYETVSDAIMPPAQLLIVHLNSRSKEELVRLGKVARMTVIVGLVTEPLSDDAAAVAAAYCSGLFVLPHHGAGLSKQIESFLAPIERKFPRIEENFSAMLTLEKGERIPTSGIDFSLEGCSVTAPIEVALGSRVRGTLILSGAVRSYSFRGEVVYCQSRRSGFKLGIRIHIDPPSLVSYRSFLRKYFTKQLQRQWKLQLAYSNVAME